jgi:hypothetical protein
MAHVYGQRSHKVTIYIFKQLNDDISMAKVIQRQMSRRMVMKIEKRGEVFINYLKIPSQHSHLH